MFSSSTTTYSERRFLIVIYVEQCFRWFVWHASSDVEHLSRVCQEPSLLVTRWVWRILMTCLDNDLLCYLKVLTECKSNTNFATVLKRLEGNTYKFSKGWQEKKVFVHLFSAKPQCQGRSLETFLTYPMHQIPRYIITLHELLAHTPHDHVERKSLQNARQQLEDLSRWFCSVINKDMLVISFSELSSGKCTMRFLKRKTCVKTWLSREW